MIPIRTTAAILVVTSVFSLSSFKNREIQASVDTASYETEEQDVLRVNKYELTTDKLYSKSIYSYSKAKVSFNNQLLTTDARVINGKVYVALRSFVNEITNYTVTYYSASRTMKVKGQGFDMEIIDGTNLIYVNGRVLFNMGPSVIMTNGRMYTPLESLAKALGISLNSTADGSASLSGRVTPIKKGELFYREDEVYWLSRIISAESRGESLLGQIAVGNVVLNRVKSSLYPNTIWSVIFDKKYGVQFSPIIDGSIYKEPTASAVIAAKICLEGYSVTKDALFFLHPAASTSSWIPKNREYSFTIGKHDFYK